MYPHIEILLFPGLCKMQHYTLAPIFFCNVISQLSSPPVYIFFSKFRTKEPKTKRQALWENLNFWIFPQMPTATEFLSFLFCENHGNQFSKTSQILEDSSKQSSIILDIALFDEILTLYCFSRLMENLRSRFKFCWIVLFSMRQ